MSRRYYEVFVSGKVQGVFFRAHTQEVASKLGLEGYVSNLPDGRVRIEVTGEESALKTFLEWCKKGPSRAVVEGLEIREIPPFHQNGFVIRRP